MTKGLPPLVSHNPLTLQASVSGGDSVLSLGVRAFKKLHQDVKALCVVITPTVRSYVDRLQGLARGCFLHPEPDVHFSGPLTSALLLNPAPLSELVGRLPRDLSVINF